MFSILAWAVLPGLWLLAAAPLPETDAHEISRRAEAIAEAKRLFRERAKARTRALIRLQNGGDLRRIFASDPESAPDPVARFALLRVLERDLGELAAYKVEEALVKREAEEVRKRWPEAVKSTRLLPPVRGQILERAGLYKDEHGIQHERAGLLFATTPGEGVKAPFPARCIFIGVLPNLGPAIILSRDERTLVIGPVDATSIRLGELVREGIGVATAKAKHLYVEVRERGIKVPPEPYFERLRP